MGGWVGEKNCAFESQWFNIGVYGTAGKSFIDLEGNVLFLLSIYFIFCSLSSVGRFSLTSNG